MKRRMFLGTGIAATALAGHVGNRASARTADVPQQPQNNPDPVVGIATDEWIAVPELSEAPVLDGDLSDAVWAEAGEFGGFYEFYTADVAEPSASYRIGWRAGKLYGAGRIPQADREAVSRIVLLIGTEPGSGEFTAVQLPVRESRLVQTLDWASDWRPGANWQQSSITAQPRLGEDPSGDLVVEFEIALETLGISGAPQGEWRFSVVHMTELATRRATSWVPVRHAMYTNNHIEGFGGPVAFDAELVSRGAWGSAFFGDAAAALWQPEVCELRWVSHREKSLRLAVPRDGGDSSRTNLALVDPTVSLEWIDPSDRVTEVASEVELGRNGRLAELDIPFQHPSPDLDGRYRLRVTVTGRTEASLTAIVSFDRSGLIQAGLAKTGVRFPGTPSTIVTAEPASEAVQQLIDLFPAQYGVPHIGHPEHAEERPLFANWTLAEDRQHIIYLGDDNDRFPNETFAETEVATARNAAGEIVEYPYYQDADGRRYYFTPALWNHQTRYVRGELSALAEQDPLGAARLLYDMAEKAAGYVPRSNNGWNTYPFDVESGPPYNYRGGFLSVWPAQELNNLDDVIAAYPVVAQTNAMELLSDELGIDVRERIRQGIFQASIDYVLSMPRLMHNTDPYVWQRLVRTARAFDEPDLVHLVLEWIDDFMASQFLSDGFWKEITPAYHQQVVGNVEIALSAIAGYSDPDGYVSPRSGRHLEDVDLSQRFPLLEQQLAIRRILVYPDGHQVPIQDTWANTTRSPLPDAAELVMPAAGLARLTDGTGDEQTQLYVMATPKYGHNQWDPLNITLFADGQELLPDIGYTYTKYRQFASSTIGHNTVVVDGANMDLSSASRDGGRIERMITAGSFSLTRASYPGAFPAASHYGRELWLLPLGDGNTVTLDLFRVVGGSRHEYTLHGDANRDAWFETQLAATPYGDYLLPPGTEVRLPVNYSDFGEAGGHYPGYLYLREVERADLSGTDRYGLTLITADADEAILGKLEITGLLEPGTNELYLGRSPSMRMTRLHGSDTTKYDNDEQADRYDMPKYVLRRDGDDLQSTFVTALEPFTTLDPGIEAVDRLPIDSGPSDAVAVSLVHGGTTHILVSNPSGEGIVTSGPVQLDGELGWIRLADGAPRELTVVGGTTLSYDSTTLSGPGAWAGVITATRRIADGDDHNGLIVDNTIDFDPSGHYVTITHPDDSVSTILVAGSIDEGDQVVLDLGSQDPGLVLDSDGSHQPYLPQKRWPSGEHAVTILPHATESFDAPAPAVGAGTITGTVVDEAGQSLTGAVVNLTGYLGIAATTDGSGGFTLSDAPAGNRRVTVQLAGYVRVVTEPVTLAAGGTATVAVTMIDRGLPPEVSDTTRYAVPGDPIRATTSLSGDVYLVPDGTERNPDSIRAVVAAGDGVTTSAPTAGEQVTLDSTGFGIGRYEVYAIDAKDRVSTPSPVTLLQTGDLSLEDDGDVVDYTGDWTLYRSENFSGGTFHYTSERNASVTVPFHGTRAVIKAHSNPAGGLADLYVDGAYAAELDYYTPDTVRDLVVYDTGQLAPGVHTVQIVTRGEVSPDNPGTQRQVRLDVAIITGA